MIRPASSLGGGAGGGDEGPELHAVQAEDWDFSGTWGPAHVLGRGPVQVAVDDGEPVEPDHGGQPAGDGGGGVAAVLLHPTDARYHGEPGPLPADIDVLAVGDGVDRVALCAAAERAEARLDIPVNSVLRPAGSWDDTDGDPLLAEVQARPLVDVTRSR